MGTSRLQRYSLRESEDETVTPTSFLPFITRPCVHSAKDIMMRPTAWIRAMKCTDNIQEIGKLFPH